MEIAAEKFVKITWGAAAGVAGAIITVVLWLAAVDSKASDALNRLDRQKDSIKEMREDITKIKESAYRSEGILEILKKRSDAR